MQQAHNTIPSQRPSALNDWDEVEPGWWYAIARDETEVHIQSDPDCGWCYFPMVRGEVTRLPSYHPDLDVIVSRATDLLSEHDRRLH